MTEVEIRHLSRNTRGILAEIGRDSYMDMMGGGGAVGVCVWGGGAGVEQMG